MSEYTLTQRLIITADETDAAGVSPKVVALGSPVKPASTFIAVTVRQVRCGTRVIHITRLFTSADLFPIVTTIPGSLVVDPACTHLTSSFFTDRTDGVQGILVELALVGTATRFNTTNLPVGEFLELAVDLVETKEPKLATVRLVDANNVELAWDGVLQPGDQIVASVDVFDLEDLGDDIKEILFRQVRLLGYEGENSMQDLIVYDTQGNMLTYRVRTFDSKVNLDGATKGATGALETGELSRVTFTQTIVVGKNDRTLATEALTDVLLNPDIT